MKKNKALTQIASLVILTSAVSGCARFQDRAKAQGDFNYQEVTLIDKFDNGDFSKTENRSNFVISDITDEQNQVGLMGEDVDVRPPTQLMAVLDGVLLDSDLTQTKVWFNAFKQQKDTQLTVWDLALEYLASKNATSVNSDLNTLSIDTGPIITERKYGSISTNTYHEEGTYKLQIAKGDDGRSVSLVVDVQSYEALNDGEEIKHILKGRAKRNIELRFINDMLQFAYLKQQSEALQAANNKPLPIKLGFDDNNQTTWIIDSEFIDVWNKLPSLLSLMSFKPVDNDKNLGYFLVRFVSQDDEYWSERNLNPIDLEEGEYFVQLGDLTGADTSLTWLDSDKKPLSDQQVTELYLSITDNVRSVILENDQKAKPL